MILSVSLVASPFYSAVKKDFLIFIYSYFFIFFSQFVTLRKSMNTVCTHEPEIKFTHQ